MFLSSDVFSKLLIMIIRLNKIFCLLYAVFKVRFSTVLKQSSDSSSELEKSNHYLSDKRSGNLLSSHIVSNAVLSAAWALTIVFGMGTGVTPRRIVTKNSYDRCDTIL